MGQPANPLTGVAVVEGVAAIGGRQAQVPASLHRRNILKFERTNDDQEIFFLSDKHPNKYSQTCVNIVLCL